MAVDNCRTRFILKLWGRFVYKQQCQVGWGLCYPVCRNLWKEEAVVCKDSQMAWKTWLFFPQRELAVPGYFTVVNPRANVSHAKGPHCAAAISSQHRVTAALPDTLFVTLRRCSEKKNNNNSTFIWESPPLQLSRPKSWRARNSNDHWMAGR